MAQVIRAGSSVRIISEDGDAASTQLFKAGLIAEDTVQAMDSYLVSGKSDLIPVNLLDYVLANGGSTDGELAAELARFQAAVNECAASGRALYMPSTDRFILIRGTVVVPDGGISIISDGCKIISRADAPVFSFVGSARFLSVGNFNVEFQLSTPPTAACAVHFAADGGFVDYSKFHNISTFGAIATIISEKTPRTTTFGLEGNVNWCVFDRLMGFGGSQLQRNVTWFKKGSGTGNVWSDTTGDLGDSVRASYHRFDGAGCVVGDTIVIGGHYSKTALTVTGECCAYEVAADTVYRSNITLNGCQTDSRMDRVFRFLSNTIKFHNITHRGNTIGGATVLGIDVPLITGRIDDRDALEWSGGTEPFDTAATGAQSQAVCKVTLLPFKAVRLTLTASGLVGGASAGTAVKVISLRASDVGLSNAVVSTSSEPAGLFDFSVSIAGLVATISVTFSPTVAGSSVSTNWEGRGVGFCIERLT